MPPQLIRYDASYSRFTARSPCHFDLQHKDLHLLRSTLSLYVFTILFSDISCSRHFVIEYMTTIFLFIIVKLLFPYKL